MAFMDDLFSDGGWGGFGGRSKGPFDPFSSFYAPNFAQNFSRGGGPKKQQQQRDPRYEARKPSSPAPRKSPPRKEPVIDIPIEEARVPSPKRSAAAAAAKPEKIPKKIFTFQSQDDAARKIQAVFRGFLVRRWKPIKQLRSIKAIAKDFAVIRESVADAAKFNAILEDRKERMMLNERVTLLLLKLDEIDAVQPLVKEVRKALIVELQQFSKPMEDKDREEHEKNRSKAQDIQIEDAEDDPDGEEAQDIEIEDAENDQDDGFFIVKRGDAEDSMDTEPESTISEEEDLRSPEKIDQEVPVSCEAVEQDQISGQTSMEGGEKMDVDVVKKLMEDNAQLKAMVAKCLEGIQWQNTTIAKLERRVHDLERALLDSSKTANSQCWISSQ
ncbi:BAG family molecular chaperone regulator 6-like [Selaginella moellendorffii]|uniref:BAG family molecular chaperone regulator 6-like n=1 Tax=Selaginella moellendorffii TaxID=88036 RepID=UPI000D1C21C2|nr:BAG family molecular chaperone regulator 6-like [Selaginella moellendorffii]|eukprot:XP_024541297.1 BAG family molecular chaperone regulator 6-like [Selaginella moellendorffii]